MPYRAAITGVSVMVPHFRRRRERYLLTNGRHACTDHLSAVSCHSRRHSLATAATMDGRAAMVDVAAAAERATVGRSCCTTTEADTAIIADVVERDIVIGWAGDEVHFSLTTTFDESPLQQTARSIAYGASSCDAAEPSSAYPESDATFDNVATTRDVAGADYLSCISAAIVIMAAALVRRVCALDGHRAQLLLRVPVRRAGLAFTGLRC